jgi:uncharacterized membrane protein YbhN (UPF0104 family)
VYTAGTSPAAREFLVALLLAGLLAALALYLALHRDEVAAITLVSPAALALCALAVLGCNIVVGPLFYVMLQHLKCGVGMLECIALSVLTTAVNTVAPLQAGAGVRALYLKQRHGFAYADFMATLYGYQVLRIVLCAVAAALAVLWMVAGEERAGLMPTLIGTLVCLALAMAACCLPRVAPTGRWLVDRLAAFTRGWHALRSEPRLLARLTGLVAVQLAGEVLVFWAACRAIGVPLSVADAIAIGTLGALAAVAGLTPGGLALFEATAALVGSAAGLNPVHTVMAALAARLVLAAVLALLTPLAVYYLCLCRSATGARGPATVPST